MKRLALVLLIVGCAPFPRFWTFGKTYDPVAPREVPVVCGKTKQGVWVGAEGAAPCPDVEEVGGILRFIQGYYFWPSHVYDGMTIVFTDKLVGTHFQLDCHGTVFLRLHNKAWTNIGWGTDLRERTGHWASCKMQGDPDPYHSNYWYLSHFAPSPQPDGRGGMTFIEPGRGKATVKPQPFPSKPWRGGGIPKKD